MNSKSWLIIAILLSLFGCAQKPSRDVVLDDQVKPILTTKKLIKKAQQAINAGEFRNADPLLQQLNSASRTSTETLQLNLLTLQYALKNKDVDQSEQILNQIDRGQLNKSKQSLQIQYGLLKAEFYELSGQFLTAARERDFLSAILSGDTQATNHKKIWQNLINISRDNLLKWSTAAPNTQFSNWLELSLIHI